MSAGVQSQARGNVRASAQNSAPLANFEFLSGELRGSTLSLLPARLVHSGTDFTDTLQLDHVGALRVAFERDFGRITRGGLLLLAAVALLAIYRPVQSLLAATFGELATQSQGSSAFLLAALHAVEFGVGLLPLLAAGLVLWAGAWLALGWIGNTVLVVVVTPVEKVFATRGRDVALFEFAQSVDACLDARGDRRG